MTRIVSAVLAAAALVLTGPAGAQQAPPPPLIDWAKVEIKTIDLGNAPAGIAFYRGRVWVAVQAPTS